MPRPRLEVQIRTSRPAFDMQALSTASRKFEVLDLRLRRGAFERSGDVTSGPSLLKVEFTPSVVFHEDGSLVVQVDARVQALRGSDATPGKRGPDALLVVDASFEVLYITNKEGAPSEAELGAFTDLNAAFTCWPYLREFVEGATSKLGMRRVTLPLFRIGEATCVQERVGKSRRPSSAQK